MKSLIKFLIIISLFFTSCIEYSEKMKLNENGSGEIIFAIGINNEIFNLGKGKFEINNFNADSIKKNYLNKKGIEFVNSRTYIKNNIRWIEIELKFDSVESLNSINNDTTQNGMIGIISLSKDRNGNIKYFRKIFPFNKNEAANGESKILSIIFSQYKWNYELQLPSKIISSNAHEVRNDSNIAKWSFSLASLNSVKSLEVTFEKKKFPWLIYSISALLIAALFIILYRVNLKRKNKS